MSNFLDENGVLYLWSKIKAHVTSKLSSYLTEAQSKELFATKDVATTSANGLMSSSDKSKLNGIATGAEVNVQSDWNVTDTASDAYIKNKPGVMTAATSSAAGKQGFVPAPAAGKQTSFLRGDATWAALSKSTVGLSNVTNDKQMKGLASGTTEGHVMLFGADGYTPKDSGFTLGKSVPSDAVFTDTVPTVMTGVVNDGQGNITPGTAGYVPAPTETQKVLYSNGTWDYVIDSVSFGYSTSGVNININQPNGRQTTGKLNLANANMAGLLSNSLFTKLNNLPVAGDIALKSDIVNMYKFKGTITDESKLPTTGQVAGDVYNITAASSYGGAGCNVAWTGEAWDALGGVFQIATITNAQLDSICV